MPGTIGLPRENADAEMPMKKQQARAEIKRQFSDWCKPRAGSANPDDMTNDVWVWLIESGLSAYEADEILGTGAENRKSPVWCFQRFGQSVVTIADGSRIHIGGEHEDYYDEDFHIYNDVVVRRPDGTLSIYGYPEDTFPPTDFHSATLVDDEVYILGCLGHPEQRQAGRTPGYVLDTTTFAIRPFETSGDAPDWLHRHDAKLSPKGDAIIVEGGKVIHQASGNIIDNIDSWQLDLETGRWKRLTNRQWPRWILKRADGTPNQLRIIEVLEWAGETGLMDESAKAIQEGFAKRGHSPDIEVFKNRYSPPVDHVRMPKDEDDFGIHRFQIDGVILKYCEDFHAVFVMVEGQLPPNVIASIKASALAALSSVEGVPYKIIDI